MPKKLIKVSVPFEDHQSEKFWSEEVPGTGGALCIVYFKGKSGKCSLTQRLSGYGIVSNFSDWYFESKEECLKFAAKFWRYLNQKQKTIYQTESDPDVLRNSTPKLAQKLCKQRKMKCKT